MKDIFNRSYDYYKLLAINDLFMCDLRRKKSTNYAVLTLTLF